MKSRISAHISFNYGYLNPNTRLIRLYSSSSRKTKSTAKSRIESTATTFEACGINEYVLHGLQRAFPHVKTPTQVQAEFMPAILDGKDVLLKDRTGTGKSFGVLLALLSKERAIKMVQPRYWKMRTSEETRLVPQPSLTTLMVVPHTDLALQYLHWVQQLRLSRNLDEVAQTLLIEPKGFDYQLERFNDTRPHLLITTPNALHKTWQDMKTLINLNTLNTVVLEEVDSLLGIPSSDTPPEVRKRWLKHPPPLKGILNTIYEARPKVSKPLDNATVKLLERSGHSITPPAPLQLILSSATLRPAVKEFLFSETNWVERNPDRVAFIEGNKDSDQRKAVVKHCAVYVDSLGGIKNVYGSSSNVNLEEQVGQPSIWSDSILPTQLYEAVAAAFALDVPLQALLIIPDRCSSKEAVQALRDLHVKAVNLATHLESSTGGDLLKRATPTVLDDNSTLDSDAPTQSSPKLIVAKQGSIRGIDLPSVSHVFIAGVTETQIDYQHIAGRVGRLGSEDEGEVKTVVTFLPQPWTFRAAEGQRKDDEFKRLKAILNMLRIKGEAFEHAM